MAKLPFFQFYPLDWLRDTAKLSSATQGQWMKILCYAWNEPERGVYEREEIQACRELGLDEEALRDLLEELQHVATVSGSVRNSKTIVRVESRRMVKEEKLRELNAIYQDNFRNKGKVRDDIRPRKEKVRAEKLEVRSQKLEGREIEKKQSSSFSVPSPAEVMAYGASVGFKIDGAAFCDFYESKGWKIGNSPMKSWQAAVRTWQRKDQKENHHASDGGPSVFSPSALVRAKREAEKTRTEP